MDREKLVVKMLGAFHFAPTSSLMGSMAAALAIAEAAIRKDEREACAAQLEERGQYIAQSGRNALEDAAAAIRARGQG